MQRVRPKQTVMEEVSGINVKKIELKNAYHYYFSTFVLEDY